jgi:hypothetical protein
MLATTDLDTTGLEYIDVSTLGSETDCHIVHCCNLRLAYCGYYYDDDPVLTEEVNGEECLECLIVYHARVCPYCGDET